MMSPAQHNWPFVINVSNSIIGVTILAMPFCFKMCGIVLGFLMLFFSTWLTLTSCHLLMKAGVTSRRRSYEFLAYFTHGVTGKLTVEIGMIGLQIGTLVAQVVIIGDLGPNIVSKATGLENTDKLRTGLIVVLCLFVGLPLGLLKDVRTLSKTSTLCVLFYTAFSFYIVMKSIPTLVAGEWVSKVNFWRTEGFFQCLPIFSFAFGCQTQLFIVYDALAEPSLKRINSIVSSAVNLCTTGYILVGFFGYIAFSSEPELSGDIINHLQEDIISDAIKLCFVISIAVSIPLIIFPCRSSLYTLLFPQQGDENQKPKDDLPGSGKIPEFHFKAITVVIVVVAMIIGILVPNVEFVLALNGATMGTLICYIFPAMFFLNVMASTTEGKGKAKMVLFFGLSIMIVCTYMTLSVQDKPNIDGKAIVSVEVPDIIRSKGIQEELKQIDENNNNVEKIKEDLLKDKVFDTGEEDKRQEPPIPVAPDDAQGNLSLKLKEQKNAVIAQNVDNTKEEEPEKRPELEGLDKEVEKGNVRADRKVQREARQERRENVGKKQEAILEKLEQQQEEQKKLIEEQKEILEELKQHKEKHQENENLKDFDDANIADQKQEPKAVIDEQKINVDVHQPAEGGNQPAQGVQQPAQGLQQPAQGVQQPAQGLQQPAQGLQQPAQGLQQPAQGLQQPAQDVQQPAQGIQKPLQGVQEQGGQQQGLGIQQPGQAVKLPLHGAEQPVLEELQPNDVKAGESVVGGDTAFKQKRNVQANQGDGQVKQNGLEEQRLVEIVHRIPVQDSIVQDPEKQIVAAKEEMGDKDGKVRQQNPAKDLVDTKHEDGQRQVEQKNVAAPVENEVQQREELKEDHVKVNDADDDLRRRVKRDVGLDPEEKVKVKDVKVQVEDVKVQVEGVKVQDEDQKEMIRTADVKIDDNGLDKDKDCTSEDCVISEHGNKNTNNEDMRINPSNHEIKDNNNLLFKPESKNPDDYIDTVQEAIEKKIQGDINDNALVAHLKETS